MSLPLCELTTSRNDMLERIEQSGLVQEGRVFLLSLEPIRAQLGARWLAREDLVWDAVEKALAKRMPPPDVFFRINDTTVLAAIASTDGYEGQVRCVEVLRTLLTFFLGRSMDEDIGISRVSNLNGGELSAEAVSMVSLGPATGEIADPSRRKPLPGSFTPSAVDDRRHATIVSDRHGQMSVTHDTVPVWRLDQGTIGAYALRQKLSVRPGLLSDADHEALAMAAADALVPMLEAYRRDGGAFAVVLPCPFSVVSTRRPRLAMLQRFSPVADIMRGVVMLEIEGIAPGVPTGLVRETVAMLKPFVRALTVAVADAAEIQAAFREAAFSGLAIHGANRPATQLEAVIRSGRRRTPNIMVRDAPLSLDPDWLRSCGASHVTWASQSDHPFLRG